MRILFKKFAAGLVLSTLALSLTPAHAEGQLRIAQQFGLVYLLLNVAQDQKLIEKHGQKQGVPVKVEYVQLSGGNAANDALLSGSIDVARTSGASPRSATSPITWSAPTRTSRPSPISATRIASRCRR
jgi:ABC-type nitrate/sulfonate/bicarbonate transport system substrate-binding protein